MFDLSFGEMMVIGVVAVVILGPERLPKVAKTAGLMIGKVQRYVSDIKGEIAKEINLDEVKKTTQELKQQVTQLGEKASEQLTEVQDSMHEPLQDIEHSFDQAKQSLSNQELMARIDLPEDPYDSQPEQDQANSVAVNESNNASNSTSTLQTPTS